MPSVPPTKRRTAGPADPRPAQGEPEDERQFGPDIEHLSLGRRRLIGVIAIAVFLGFLLMAVFGAPPH